MPPCAGGSLVAGKGRAEPPGQETPSCRQSHPRAPAGSMAGGNPGFSLGLAPVHPVRAKVACWVGLFRWKVESRVSAQAPRQSRGAVEEPR